jgi:plasmid stability protein
MASILILYLDERTKARLRIRAAHNGRSMEDEARTLLRNALEAEPETASDLATAIRKRFERFGGVEMEVQPREPIRDPPRPRR